MADVIKLSVFAVICCAITLTVRAYRPELAQQAAVAAGADPAGEEGRAIAQLHRQWLGYTWPSYSAPAHLGLAEMYVADERFTAYYDARRPGCAAFLRDAIAALVHG